MGVFLSGINRPLLLVPKRSFLFAFVPFFACLPSASPRAQPAAGQQISLQGLAVVNQHIAPTLPVALIQRRIGPGKHIQIAEVAARVIGVEHIGIRGLSLHLGQQPTIALEATRIARAAQV